MNVRSVLLFRVLCVLKFDGTCALQLLHLSLNVGSICMYIRSHEWPIRKCVLTWLQHPEQPLTSTYVRLTLQTLAKSDLTVQL